ncbi:MAG: NUDIX domain-containing protein [Limimaricola sp.]|uniref:NUDIX hydrolase n=1 Tax=Limimaricola sp. TaxID=2211665 RepID=UPI001D3885A2|nr:NUDIX hydrolase [Limimaricola sp.]MBI1415870.1 NUDIX domain-containing protein [Limimaricola sp.]
MTDDDQDRDPALQFAALCHRRGRKGREVLLVTSSRGRWILPKGWPIDGQHPRQTALQEAWEEAGVKRGKPSKSALGSFESIKRFDDGEEIPCEIKVFEIKVQSMSKVFPEVKKRKRAWVSPKKAAKMIGDPALRDVFSML